MWTGKFSRYVVVLLCAFGCNAVSAQKTVNVYFNQRQTSGEPTISFGSNAPADVKMKPSGFTWASKYKFSNTIYRECWDRIVVKNTNPSLSTATISFTGFKYEIENVKWNVICDLLADSPDVTTTITSLKEETSNGTFSGNSHRFNADEFTTKSLGFKGLKSLEIKDKIKNDYSRAFIKAGTEKQEQNRGIFDDHYFAFQITYYEPSVSLSSVSNTIKLGETLDVSNLYSINHKGAFDFTPTYESGNENIFTVDKNGVITPKNLGKAYLTVTITDGVVTKNTRKLIEVVSPNLGSNQYLVNLKYCDGTDNGETVIATYGQPLPNGLTAPTREGYEFKGYYDNENQDYAEGKGLNYGGTQYYNKDMAGVKSWSYNYGGTIYGHWAPKIYIVTLDAAGGVLPNPVVKDNAGNFNITKKSNSVMTLSIAYRTGDDKTLVHSTAKKPGYELLGWFDSNGKKIISVDEKSRNCTITDNGGYWTENGKTWNHIGDITLTAHYRKKYQYKNNVISFDNEKVEAGDDWLWSVVNDLVGSAKDVYETKGEQTMVFDLRKSTNMWTNNKYERLKVMQSLQKDEYKDYISPNVLVYFNDNENQAWYNGNVSDCYNAVSLDNKCKSLVVTDRYEIKVPHAFKADKALYERNKDYSSEDAAKAQAANSQWGTLCLPYPIRNNANNVKFYKLAGLKNNYMHFTPMDEAVIPANTPVLYKRLEGVGSEVKIEEAGVNVPVNTSYSTNPGSSLDSWQFIGTLTTKIFCGKDYDNKKVPADAEKMDGSKEIYYFKQDQFTHLANKGKVTMLPYRAYFNTTPANAKFTTFSLIAIDEEGATDITNLIDNDAEGDGKIYDLNGRRVMQPVSGRLYIVNGQKKVY